MDNVFVVGASSELHPQMVHPHMMMQSHMMSGGTSSLSADSITNGHASMEHLNNNHQSTVQETIAQGLTHVAAEQAGVVAPSSVVMSLAHHNGMAHSPQMVLTRSAGDQTPIHNVSPVPAELAQSQSALMAGGIPGDVNSHVMSQAGSESTLVTTITLSHRPESGTMSSMPTMCRDNETITYMMPNTMLQDQVKTEGPN